MNNSVRAIALFLTVLNVMNFCLSLSFVWAIVVYSSPDTSRLAWTERAVTLCLSLRQLQRESGQHDVKDDGNHKRPQYQPMLGRRYIYRINPLIVHAVAAYGCAVVKQRA